jgi:hypothetical protein
VSAYFPHEYLPANAYFPREYLLENTICRNIKVTNYVKVKIEAIDRVTKYMWQAAEIWELPNQ